MQPEITRVVRKLRSSGFVPTVQALWKELYLMEFLQSDYIMDKLHAKYNIESAGRRNFSVSRDEREIETHLPARIWIDSEESFDEIETEPVPEPELFSYNNCHFFVPPGVGFTTDKKVIRDTFASEIVWNRGRGKTWLPALFYYHGIYRTNQFFRQENQISNFDIDVALPVVPYWHNYYHWTMECLPKLRWLEHTYCETNRTPKVLVPSNMSSWMKESLSLLDIDNIYQCDEKIYTVKELVVPTSPEPSKADCQWVRNQMLSKIDNNDKTANKRIYITRQKANRRSVENIDEMISVLNDFDFQSYALEEISVEKQIKLFSKAEAVVGPHGAGLTNMIYAPDPVVIELFGDKKKTSYYRLAELLGFEYTDVCGQKSGVDITVDPNILRATLKERLA